MNNFESINNSEPTPVHEAALGKLRMIAGEYFDDYLIVVKKGDMTWDCYNSNCSGYGMASMVAQKINKKWYQGNDK